MSDNSPRPNLSSDPEYLKEVRDLIKRKGELEEIHFEYLSDVLEELGTQTNIYAQITPESISDTIKNVIEGAYATLSTKELGQPLAQKLYRLWDYLSESDPIEKAELIYVFGGISELAVKEAIRLKIEDFAPKILFSGKHGSYMKDVVDLSEAERYLNLAVELGVKQEDILLEKESINTPENIVKSAALLHSLEELPKSIIAVSLPYHMKRASLTMRAGFDWDFKLFRHPGQSAKYTRETYFKDQKGWSYICFEYIKLYGARQMGHF